MTPTPGELEFAATALLLALSARNLETGDHCPRVARLALELGRTLQLTGDDLYALHLGSLLHDIGKLQTPDAVLCKPDKLDADEWQIMRRHPTAGAAMLRAANFPEAACLVVEQHHERFDGQGYPFNLQRQQISLNARIFAVADTFDAITADRCYRAGAAPAVALHEIQSWSGKQFDPEIVDAFLALHLPTRQSADLAT